jgi:hypothetical protein
VLKFQSKVKFVDFIPPLLPNFISTPSMPPQQPFYGDQQQQQAGFQQSALIGALHDLNL